MKNCGFERIDIKEKTPPAMLNGASRLTKNQS